ncbi:hypothetical protein D3227_09295 [Mesorhizobium waimense]|uniref:Uncharacterized protein n=1 Tax=Mesorhizobium waimense TaxID=1300307 RepID=A0A3A5KVX3_9HYPH|nr:hypothetical protein D3227_09295 [Mesorhizobium waimense]
MGWGKSGWQIWLAAGRRSGSLWFGFARADDTSAQRQAGSGRSGAADLGAVAQPKKTNTEVPMNSQIY